MRPLAVCASIAILLSAGSLAEAASSLILTDGQVIKGTEIKRQGDSYLITMAGGNTVAFPVALVTQIKLVDDGPQPAPPGFDFTGPRTLAGPKSLPSQDVKDQQKVLGPSTRWPKDIIDPTWVPTSAYDPDVDVLAGSRATWSTSAIDTTWKPTSGFDLSKDVFSMSHASWSKNVIDTTWTPKDGFGFKSMSTKRAETPAAPDPTPWSCAEKLFADEGKSESMSVKVVDGGMSSALGVTLYEAQGVLSGLVRKAVFTISDGECRLVGGDADALMGLNLPVEHAVAQEAASFNAAMVSRGGARVPTGVDKIDYALAFVSLTDPAVSGIHGASLRMIKKPEELRSILAKPSSVCPLGRAKRRREERNATSAFAAPKVESGNERDVVTFLTWSSAVGVVSRNTVVLARGGVVSAKRDIIATHVGSHTK
jgi:hypothetical protein